MTVEDPEELISIKAEMVALRSDVLHNLGPVGFTENLCLLKAHKVVWDDQILNCEVTVALETI